MDGDGSGASLTITWTFPSAVSAVGLDYFFVDPDALNVTVDGMTRAIRESADSDPRDGFFGFTSPTPVTTIVFDTYSPNSVDEFSLDDLQFGTTSPVPLPPASRASVSSPAAAGI